MTPLKVALTVILALVTLVASVAGLGELVSRWFKLRE